MSSEQATRPSKLLRFAIWLTLVNSWVLFEEIVVDRQGLWRYMPLYRVGTFCSWDALAMTLFGVLVWAQFRERRTI